MITDPTTITYRWWWLRNNIHARTHQVVARSQDVGKKLYDPGILNRHEKYEWYRTERFSLPCIYGNATAHGSFYMTQGLQNG